MGMAINMLRFLGKGICRLLTSICIMSGRAVLLLISWIASIMLLPFLLLLHCMTLLVRSIRNGTDKKEIDKFRGGLAYWISAIFGNCLYASLLCLVIFVCTPSLKHLNFYDLPIWKWMVVLTIICVVGGSITFIHCIWGAWCVRFLDLNGDSCYILFGGLIELANSGLFLFAELLVIRVAPVMKQPTILGLQARKWVQVILVVLVGHNAICTLTCLCVVYLRPRYPQCHEQNDPCNSSPSGGIDLKEVGFFESILSGKIEKTIPPAMGEMIGPKFLLKKVGRVFLPSLGNEVRRKYVVYFAEGLRKSVNFLLTSLMFLLTWNLYFGLRLNRNSPTVKEVYDYVTWTLVCIFVTSILWLVKNGIVLSWAARVVYHGFHDEIVKRSTQLWLLGILGGPDFDILNIDWKDRYHQLNKDKSSEKKNRVTRRRWRRERSENTQFDGDGDEQLEIGVVKIDLPNEHDYLDKESNASTSCGIEEKDADEGEAENITAAGSLNDRTGEEDETTDTTNKTKKKKRRPRLETRARKILVPDLGNPKDLPTHIIMPMATYFLRAEDSLSKKNYVSDFCKQWCQINPYRNINEDTAIRDLSKVETHEEDLKVLCKEMQSISVDIRFENWIKRAHKTSIELARSLSGAKEVVDCLNQIIACLLIAVMIVIWLLLTGIATTKVIVFIASPVLAATFIFGDACKTFFQGIMFTYVLHPFNVGDRCTIAGTSEMEVKRIGIWKTIFSMVGSSDEVVYPNSLLATVAIVNHKDIDPDDYVELSLNSSLDDTEIEKLKSDIERLIDSCTTIRKRHPGVVVESEDGVRVGVHFKHEEISFGDLSSAKALETKSEMRDKLFREIKSYLDGKQIAGENPNSAV